jgi:hypothetical protein
MKTEPSWHEMYVRNGRRFLIRGEALRDQKLRLGILLESRK